MLWFDAPAQASDQERVANQQKDALRSRELHFHLGAMDGDNNLPTLIGKLKIDWLDFPVDDILQQFTTLKEGILRGVFKQKAARAEKAGWVLQWSGPAGPRRYGPCGGRPREPAWARRASPRSPRSPVRSSTVQYFVVRSSIV